MWFWAPVLEAVGWVEEGAVAASGASGVADDVAVVEVVAGAEGVTGVVAAAVAGGGNTEAF